MIKECDVFIAAYAEVGIPMLCRLADFPRVSRLYSPESEPPFSQLLEWYRCGHIVRQAEQLATGRMTKRHGRWVNVHQTLLMWRVHPGTFADAFINFKP